MTSILVKQKKWKISSIFFRTACRNDMDNTSKASLRAEFFVFYLYWVWKVCRTNLDYFHHLLWVQKVDQFRVSAPTLNTYSILSSPGHRHIQQRFINLKYICIEICGEPVLNIFPDSIKSKYTMIFSSACVQRSISAASRVLLFSRVS